MKLNLKKVFAIVLSVAVTITAAFGAQGSSKGKFLRSHKAVAGEYIVVLKNTPGAPDVSATADRLTRKHSGSIKHKYRRALSGFSVRLTEQQALALSNDPDVAYVEENGLVHAVDVQYSPTWGLDRIDQRDLPLNNTYDNLGLTGAGVTVYVMDTGIRTTHQDFGGRAYVGADFIGDGLNGNDGNGHGTHVAATIGGATYGMAKQVNLCAVRVLPSFGPGSWDDVLAAIDWISQNHSGPSVVNMSLGGGTMQSVDQAVRDTINLDGITYVIAAGNDNQDADNQTPARVVEAITVGASDANDQRTYFSNYGSVVDLFAPGASITSAWNSSDSATNTIDGTSMAAPHVAGLAALYLQSNPTASPADVQTALINNATPDKITNEGPGTTRRLAFLQNGSVQYPSCDSVTNSGSPTTGATFAVYANNVINSTDVKFKAWTNANGQDDLVETAGVFDAANNRWTCTVSISGHGNQTGVYSIQAWGQGTNGQWYSLGSTSVTVNPDRVYINGWNLPGHPVKNQGYPLSWQGNVQGVSYVVLFTRRQGYSQWMGCGSGGANPYGFVSATGSFGFGFSGVWEFGVGNNGAMPTSVGASITVQ